ncbi:hypothetical protein EJB05_06358 [Eragrostis curvula]|uniref:Uncharacterized protein n=1 Tax=Eragrostis curvula TaxID=38414 RepID=A0A5J9WFR5_9POAL|nr:hypothetical protein EJB05_06358 [Eragrostis curvula]
MASSDELPMTNCSTGELEWMLPQPRFLLRKPSRFHRYLRRRKYIGDIFDFYIHYWIEGYGGGSKPALVDAYMGAVESVVCVKIPLLLDTCLTVKHRRRAFADLFCLWKVLYWWIRPALLAVVESGDEPPEEVERWASRAREMSYGLEDDIDVLLSRVEHAYKRSVLDMARRWRRIWSSFEEKTKQMTTLDPILTMYRRHGRTFMTMPDRIPEFDPLLKSTEEIVGIEGQANEVISLLMEDQLELKVVSIVGHGGSGKTTLTKLVYSRIRDQFDCTAFITISGHPDWDRIFGEMISDLGLLGDFSENDYSFNEVNIDKLQILLKDRRYLIIFDDVWSMSDVYHLISSLSGSHCSGRIIITTRIIDETFGNIDKISYYLFKMKPLSDDDSQELFLTRIFGSKDSCPDDLKKVSKAILKRCRGLPLAIIAISGLLVSKPCTIEEWKKVHVSLSQAGRETSNVNAILNISFHALPPHLKSCMLYLSIFPEDYVIGRKQLVWRWIAEGFIMGFPHELEENGNSCFDVLIRQNLIQAVDVQYDGRAKCCRVHDMVLEFIISISTKLNFVIVQDHKESRPIVDKIRRLSYQSYNAENARQKMSSDVLDIRSFNLFGTVKEVPHLEDFKAMRVLDLGSCRSIDNNHIKFILRLFLLEYLSLCQTKITELPEEICNLKYLQTLDLRGCGISKLPSTFARLQLLARLLVQSGVTLPDDIGNMQALELLLSVYMPSNSIKFVEELGKLTGMRTLEMTFGKPVDMENEVRTYTHSLVSSLNKLKNLKTLKIHAKEGSPLDSLMDIYPTFQMLRELGIGYISRLPSWIQFQRNLVHLEVQVITMKEEDLYILQGISTLIYLEVTLKCAPKEMIIIGNEGFGCLQEFHLICSDVGLRLVFQAGAMPRLKTLHLCLVARGAILEDGGVYSSVRNLSALENLHAEVDCCGSTREEVEAMEASIMMAAGEHHNRLTFDMQKNSEALMVMEEEVEEAEEEEEEEEEDEDEEGEEEE